MPSRINSRAKKSLGPVFLYWARYDLLTVQEAALLMKGLDPRAWDDPELPAWFDSDLTEEYRLIAAAARVGKLEPHFLSDQGFLGEYSVSMKSFIEWLPLKGRAALADALKDAQAALLSSHPSTPLTPTSLAAPSPGALMSTEIAAAFDGLNSMDETIWKKRLGDMPKWIAAALVQAGGRGVAQRRWDPVQIGSALVSKFRVPAKLVRARFQREPCLKPWLEHWKTHEADYLT